MRDSLEEAEFFRVPGSHPSVGAILPHAPSGRIAIVGTPRSGTTILGKLLRAMPGVEMLVEPFHPLHGIRAATRRFPHADRGDLLQRSAIDEFFAGTSGDFRMRTRARRLASWGQPQSNLRTYHRARRRRPRTLVIKDPFLALSARYLVEAHGFKILWALRHPAAVFSSHDRLGWDATRVLDEWCDEGVIDPATRERADCRAAWTGTLWQVINGHLATVQSALPHAVLPVRHEDFCREPTAIMTAVARHCGLSLGAETEAALRYAVSGAIVVPTSLRVHTLRRTAAALPDAWRSRVDPVDETILRAQCGALYGALYGSDW